MKRQVALAWKVSPWWLRVLGVVIVLMLIRSVFLLFAPAPLANSVGAATSNTAANDIPGRQTAIDTCRSEIISRATNRSSVEFHSLSSPPAVSSLPDGGVLVFIKFSAKNGYGSQSTSIARCALHPGGTIVRDFSAEDSR
jgi:hypothetical protein